MDGNTAALTGTTAAIAVRVFQAFARSMPAPKPDSFWYCWLFHFCQELADNRDKAAQPKP